ncbi:MAG: hypothetical protein KDI07_05210 [Anaerolineae bacterium]|nr:hypothetical protein [Anaerolineae bacterium]MCB1870327.1 hypothetical protein [Gammaproteobacteria bacterium]
MEWPHEGEGPCACRFVRREYMGKCEQIEWCGLHAKQRDELERLRSAPVAVMDTRDVLGICAPTEEDFPALYALQGKRVRLVLDDETPND